MPYADLLEETKLLNDDDVVWRYVNFAKYANLLDKQKQYFVSGKKLQEIDPFEGYFEKMEFLPHVQFDEYDKHYLEQMDERERHEIPKSVFLNCWHINEDESDAMWKIYATMEQGIAIRTTIKKLKASFHKYKQRVYMRKVHYVDIRKRNVSTWVPYRFSRKGISFSHERELRVFVDQDYEGMECVTDEKGAFSYQVIPQDKIEKTERNENGIYVNVDLDQFIEQVYVSPLSEKWFVDLVKAITKIYGLNSDIVKQSNLYAKSSN